MTRLQKESWKVLNLDYISDEDCTKEVYVKKASGGDGYTVINRDSVKGDTAPK